MRAGRNSAALCPGITNSNASKGQAGNINMWIWLGLREEESKARSKLEVAELVKFKPNSDHKKNRTGGYVWSTSYYL